jgi:aminopeptidase N
MQWLSQGQASMTLTSSPAMPWTNADWVVFNKHQTGYYRVNYDEAMWQQIVEELVDGNYTIIPVINRAQLIDDAYTFARVNQVPYSTVFGLLEYLSHELDYAPWTPASRALTAIDRRMASLESYHHFQSFVHHKVQPLFESLGVQNLNNDTYFDRLARNVAIRWACYVGLSECLEATNERLKHVIQTGAVIEADVRAAIFCNGLRQADEADFLAIMVRLASTTTQADRNMLIDSLGCSQDFELLSSLLASTLATTNVNYSTAERIRILNAAIQGGIVGVRAVLQFLDTNFLQVIAMYPLGSVVNNLAPWIGNQELQTQFTDLTTRLVMAGQITNEVRNNAVQTAQGNLQWVTDHGGVVNEWLNLYIDRRNGGGSVQVWSVLLVLGTIVSIISL